MHVESINPIATAEYMESRLALIALKAQTFEEERLLSAIHRALLHGGTIEVEPRGDEPIAFEFEGCVPE